MLAEHERTGGINILELLCPSRVQADAPLVVSLAIAYGLTYSGLLAGGITSKGLAAQLLYFANYYGLFFDPGNTVPEGTRILGSRRRRALLHLLPALDDPAARYRSSASHDSPHCLVSLPFVILAWRIYLVQSRSLSLTEPIMPRIRASIQSSTDVFLRWS